MDGGEDKGASERDLGISVKGGDEVRVDEFGNRTSKTESGFFVSEK